MATNIIDLNCQAFWKTKSVRGSRRDMLQYLQQRRQRRPITIGFAVPVWQQLLAVRSFLVMVKYRTIRSCDLDFWPVTLKFDMISAVVEIHVSTKFHQARYSGSWVIAVTEKKTNT